MLATVAMLLAWAEPSKGAYRDMEPLQFRDMIVIPTLMEMDTYYKNMYSEAAVMLILGTALVESDLRYLKQNRGPALGVYQIEPSTADDVMVRYIAGKPHFHKMFEEMVGGRWRTRYKEMIVSDLKFATMVARLRYWMEVDIIPSDLDGVAKYWETHYNSCMGKGSYKDFVRKYKINVSP